MNSLSNVEALHMSAVLEDCIDQLIILGRIMPVAYPDKITPSVAQVVNDDISQLVESQKQLEASYESVVSSRSSKQPGLKHDQGVHAEVQKAGAELRNNAAIFAFSLKQNPLAKDNLDKIQSDRSYLEHILHDTMVELRSHGTYQSLVDAVAQEKENKAEMEEVIRREEESRKHVKQLEKQINEVRRERNAELQQRNEMIAHLKDQLQEMKAKTMMEGKYVKKMCDVSVAQTQKRCLFNEKTLQTEIEELKAKIDEENRVNAEVESFLRTHIEKRQELLEFWINKYEVDVEQKQKDLDLLKAAKAKDLERLQELTRLYAEYEQVVIEDRIEKEKARRRLEQEARELAACIKCQAWWRGVMVRRCLGPYKKKKKKAGKKGKDDKDKGKKGKK
jgi:kinesin family protein 6/9